MSREPGKDSIARQLNEADRDGADTLPRSFRGGALWRACWANTQVTVGDEGRVRHASPLQMRERPIDLAMDKRPRPASMPKKRPLPSREGAGG